MNTIRILLACGSLLAMCSGIARAQSIITFTDTAVNDTIDVSVTGSLAAQTSKGLQPSGDPYTSGANRPMVEYGRVTFSSPDNFTLGNYALIFTEPAQDLGNPAGSDILNVLVKNTDTGNGTLFDIFFESDYFGSPLLIPGSVVVGSIEETGLSQPVTNYFTNIIPGDIQIFASSDLNAPEVPEPGTLALVAVGLLASAGLKYCRRG